jgi:peptidoglycan/LPS O-acetylase OafA/YrhL
MHRRTAAAETRPAPPLVPESFAAAPAPVPVPAIDWFKAIASQLIVWHHLVIYGPMSRAVWPAAPDLFGWLADPARLAVQVFLVTGGYLAARSLMPTPGQVAALGWRQWPRLVGQRYLRLARPALVAMALAVAAAWLARVWMDDADTPGAPTLLHLLANALFLHDLVGVPALSAGLWYVAIDLQLYALLAALALLLRACRLRGVALGAVAVAAVAGLAGASLLWLNRLPQVDEWAVYFFGSYGLGVLAHWVARLRDRSWRLLALLPVGLVVALALDLEWRSRLALAALVALALACNAGAGTLPRLWGQGVVARLSRSAYGVFLVHYPVSLLVASLVTVWAEDSLAFNALGLVAAWGLSLAAGQALHRWVECWPWGRAAAAVKGRTRSDRPAPAASMRRVMP